MEIENFAERMQRILLVAPLYHLGRRQFLSRRDSSVKYSGMELGLLMLLYFFEQMLSGRRQAGIRGLAEFLRRQTHGELFAQASEYEQLARELVAAFRPTSGRRTQAEFYDWEHRQTATVQYSYLRAGKADVAANEQYYVLDEQGLELIFATKEYFSEYQLSINQLILRKQLERGQFALALRQIQEMRLDVENLETRMARIRREIHRNIISEDTLARYRKIVDDLNQRLQSEDKTFRELKEFVRETRDRVRDNVDKDPERRAYENIAEVERRLDFVHGMHSKLLRAGIQLGTEALIAAEESLYFNGVDRFNFQQEITSRMFSSPLPPWSARRLVEPFLELEQVRLWSPLAVFFPQRLERLAEERPELEFPEIGAEVHEEKELDAVQERYALIMRVFLAYLDQIEAERTTLGDFCHYLAQGKTDCPQDKQFFLFWLLLHRQHELHMNDESIGEKSPYARILQDSPELASIVVVENGRILDFPDFTMSDMDISIRRSD